MARTAKLKYDRWTYTPEGSKSLSDKELRQEYSRLRSIARKRLERLGESEFKTSEVYRQNKSLFKPVKDISSEREMRYLLSEVTRFVTKQAASVSGLAEQRKEAIATLHSHGYDFVNKGNYKKFAEFMEFARSANMGRIYDSERVAEFYEENEKKRISKKKLQSAFLDWQKSQKGGEIQHKDYRSSDLYRQGMKKK